LHARERGIDPLTKRQAVSSPAAKALADLAEGAAR